MGVQDKQFCWLVGLGGEEMRGIGEDERRHACMYRARLMDITQARRKDCGLVSDKKGSWRVDKERKKLGATFQSWEAACCASCPAPQCAEQSGPQGLVTACTIG